MYNSVKSGPIVLDYSTPTHQIMLVVNVSNKTITIVNSGSGLENHESCGALYNLWKTYKVENNFNDFLGILRIFKECVDKQIENQYITRITFPNISWNKNTLNYQHIVDNMKYVLNSMRPCNENNSIFLSFIYNLIYDFNQLRPTGSRIKTCSAFTFEKDTGQIIANELNDTFNSLYARYSITFFKFQKIEYAQLSNNEYTFYTNAQKSGSCSWFSLLWSLFLFIIHQTQDKKIENIIIIINTFFTEFAGYLNDTKKELFKKNYIYNSFDCYLSTTVLNPACTKLGITVLNSACTKPGIIVLKSTCTKLGITVLKSTCAKLGITVLKLTCAKLGITVLKSTCTKLGIIGKWGKGESANAPSPIVSTVRKEIIVNAEQAANASFSIVSTDGKNNLFNALQLLNA